MNNNSYLREAGSVSSQANQKQQIISERALRKRAARQQLKLVKFRQDSRWFNQYGPFALADSATGYIEVSGLTLGDVVLQLSRSETQCVR